MQFRPHLSDLHFNLSHLGLYALFNLHVSSGLDLLALSRQYPYKNIGNIRRALRIGIFSAFIAHNLVDWGLLAAMGIIYMVPAVLLYFAVRRYLLTATLTGGLAGT